MKRITDPTFKYRPSHDTDVAETFRRIRSEQERATNRDKANEAERSEKVEQFPLRKAMK